MKTHYDYIIVGAGCAGLSLLMRMLDHPACKDKQILLIDKTAKSANDRTWCFWEKEAGYFENLVCKEWRQLWVKHYEGSLPLGLDGYAYKMIRAQDFYRHCFARIRNNRQVTWLIGNVSDINTQAGSLQVDGTSYTADYIFSAVLPEAPVLRKKDIYLLQHFRGWWVTTNHNFFDATQADLMNFRTDQQYGCAFMYMLPLTPRQALVEYTLFSAEMLTDAQYDAGLQAFMTDELKLSNFTISEVENGVIPMTTYNFTKHEGKVVYIGTAGGQTKASTGFTFQYIQRHSQQIVEHLAGQQHPGTAGNSHARYAMYDGFLLRVLQDNMYPGADIFFQLFKKNKAPRVLRFLDNQSTFWDELNIMNSVPRLTFMRAGWQQYVAP